MRAVLDAIVQSNNMHEWVRVEQEQLKEKEQPF